MKKLFETSSIVSLKEIVLRNLASKIIHKKNEQYALIRGQRMAVYANDLIGMEIFLDGEFEKNELNDIYDLFKFLKIDIASNTAIDIGANIGNHTINFSKRFSHVYSFEPNPHTFKILKFNTDSNNNVTAFNLGLSDTNGFLSLYEDISNYGRSSAIHTNGISTVNIEVKKLDDFIDLITNVKLIKIDVEGMEFNVLNGAKKVISKFQPIIIFEQHLTEFKDKSETQSIRYLRDLEYELIWVINSNASKPWIVRRLNNIYEIFMGKKMKRIFTTSSKVPPDNYTMLIAVPKYYLQF